MAQNEAFPSIRMSGHSEIGRAKTRYMEDRIKYDHIVTRGGLNLALAIVADGIGGENAGERAATMTADGVLQYCANSDDTSVPGMLKAALTKVNSAVFKEAQQKSHLKNMGSTAAVAAICNNRLYVANVGDSRIYLVRSGKVSQLTVDHTWERVVVQSGKLTPGEAARHPRRDELVRSIGYEADVAVDLGLYFQGPQLSEAEAERAQGLPLLRGDRVVLCSDGLIKSLPSGKGHFVEIPEIVTEIRDSSSSEVSKALVRKALSRSADDNVSVVVMEVPGGRHLPRVPRSALAAAAAVLGIAFLAIAVLPQILNPPAPPAPALAAVPPAQFLVAAIWNTSLRVGSAENVTSQASVGNTFDLKSGTTLTTTGSGSGYAFVGFPGQAEAYLGDGTEIVVKSEADLVLNKGTFLLVLPGAYGHRFLVETPDNAQAWIGGSTMGLLYDASAHELYVDCLQDVCGYMDNSQSQTLHEGSHITLNGTRVISLGGGTRNELWQFVPDKVAAPTATPSPIPTAAATEACRYKNKQGTPCPPP
jgi:protein phosphatase